MYYSIFRNNELVTRVKPLNSSELVQTKQTQDVINLNFELTTFVEILIGDYIVFEKTQSVYRLNIAPEVVEIPKRFKYTCKFEGSIHELEKTKVFLETEKESGGYYMDYKFSLTGNANSFLDFIILNLNRNSSIQYVKGNYDETDTITVDFNNWNVFEAVNQLSSLLSFDWYLDGNTLHFTKRVNNLAYVFQVGLHTGFTEITRVLVERQKIETVVYGFGSTKNLPPRTGEDVNYDSPVLSENRLAFEGVDGESKLENNVDKYGRIESVQEFDIYPEFTGAVGTVVDERTFQDNTIEFDINDYLLADIKPKITFISGKLIGLTFNISYDHSTKQITMDYYSDESGEYPNDIIFAETGDEYKIFDIAFPESYITDAQQRLQEATQAYLDESSENLTSYSGKIDHSYILKNNIVLNLGDTIRIVSPVFRIDDYYEIKEIIQNINKPEEYEIKFGDLLPKGLISQLQDITFNTNQSIYTVSSNSVSQNTVNNIVNEGGVWETL